MHLSLIAPALLNIYNHVQRVYVYKERTMSLCLCLNSDYFIQYIKKKRGVPENQKIRKSYNQRGSKKPYIIYHINTTG